ncbi:F0F1 ATP synthase subunit A [Ornithinimicrobium sp. F0845]|uniref:F0F1 ATP synthase subunit A n=1 Tax=Ornithinimicrobium sp. F0845 TaxID=2926412 RepID=UPI001FF2FCC6|nr:F0F1 ATP synthase subunit A [Ornithinimicrobium sp. F0845]
MSPTAAVLLPMAEGESHFPPDPSLFWQPLVKFGTVDLFGSEMTLAITRPMVILALTVGLLSWWLIATTKKAAVVPSKGQAGTEAVYNFVRNGVARDMIGSRDFLPFVPFLFTMFVLILFNNWMGIIPPVQMPTMGRIGIPIALTLLVYIVYHWVGVKKHGFVGYFKFMIPAGLPGWIKPAILGLEMLTFFVTRPLTLALRLFGNMFAGHLLLVVFIIGGWELFQQGGFLTLVSVPAWIMAFAMTVFEALVQFLQAYVFVLLAASYIGGALVDEH